ncbi:Zn-ribbon domain-containing OB-fold protein [Candidatus Binatus sp.]|uniref:Zn-ribbon domain-containing OB-fold protein n=1 Tax=Candidatus Binatus sp. TaxID=2811406 RepID=UPI003BB19015
MPKRKAVHAELYSPDAIGNPVLNGGKCRACGYVFFPPQRYGCESCGAPPEKLEAAELRGRGRLHSYATVHLYQGKDIEAPFTVGLIVLDDGPAIRSMLTERTAAGLAIGDRMASVLVAAGTDPDGNEMVELRFARAAAGP